MREIFERYAAGESSKAISHDLNRRGVPSPGASWTRTDRVPMWAHTTICGAVAKQDGIVRNSIYIGRAAWNKRAGKRVPGTGRRVQRARASSEWIVRDDETLRIVSEDLWIRRPQKAATEGREAGAIHAEWPTQVRLLRLELFDA